jgi:hypothetical protein
MLTFDDSSIGWSGNDNKTVQVVYVERPPGINLNVDWYDFAGRLCRKFNALERRRLESLEQLLESHEQTIRELFEMRASADRLQQSLSLREP